MTTLYGIPNCDTVKKARKWLEVQGIDYSFHDFRADGIEAEKVQGWLDELGWEGVVNKRSTTWKQLDEATRKAMNNETAFATILGSPTLIKRPVLVIDGDVHIGFKADNYAGIFT